MPHCDKRKQRAKVARAAEIWGMGEVIGAECRLNQTKTARKDDARVRTMHPVHFAAA